VKGTARRLGLGFSLLLALAACGTSGASPSAGGAASDTSQKSGTVATDFSARDIEGRTVRLSDYLGKQAILIDFWATWCEPCLAEMSHLRKLYEANKSKGFVVIAVSMDGPDTVAEVPSFAKRNGMVFPVVLDEDSHVAGVYNPKKAAPLSVLIDKSGKVVKTHEGYNPGDEEILAKEIAAVLTP
jgi:peroxiredoxin